MEQTPSTPAPATNTTTDYVSNPFILAFRAFSKFFNANAGWGVAIIILGIFGGFFQLFGQFLGSPPSDEPMQPASLDPGFSSMHIEPAALAAVIIGVLVIITIAAAVGFILQVFIGGMFAYVSLQSQKGQAVSFGEAFHATTQRFGRLLVAQAWAGLKIFLWSLLLVVPGIIAALRYALLPYVIMAEPASEKSLIKSHDRVKAITKGKLLEVFGLGFAAGIIPFVGGVLQIAGSGAQYQQLASTFDHNVARPKTHWLNYLALIVAGLFLLLIVGLGLLFLALYAYAATK